MGYGKPIAIPIRGPMFAKTRSVARHRGSGGRGEATVEGHGSFAASSPPVGPAEATVSMTAASYDVSQRSDPSRSRRVPLFAAGHDGERAGLHRRRPARHRRVDPAASTLLLQPLGVTAALVDGNGREVDDELPGAHGARDFPSLPLWRSCEAGEEQRIELGVEV